MANNTKQLHDRIILDFHFLLVTAKSQISHPIRLIDETFQTH